jgi:hypothetical protein
VQQPLEEMGMKAAEVLLARIENPERPWAEEIVMQPQLIVRESSGPVPHGRASPAEISTLGAGLGARHAG